MRATGTTTSAVTSGLGRRSPLGFLLLGPLVREAFFSCVLVFFLLGCLCVMCVCVCRVCCPLFGGL